MLRHLLLITLTALGCSSAFASTDDWITVNVIIFQQKTDSPFTMPSTITFLPNLPSPEEQMARNINAMQLPTLHNRHTHAWASMLKKADYEIRYSTQWQQPDPSANDKSPHYLLDYNLESPPTAAPTSDETEHDATTIPTPEKTNTDEDSNNPTRMLMATTQGHLHALLPQLFSGDDWMVPSYNPWVRGTISLQSHGYYYQFKLNLYAFKDKENQRPDFHWQLSKAVKLGDTRYIDHDRWGMIVAIKRSKAPASLSTPTAQATPAETTQPSKTKSNEVLH